MSSKKKKRSKTKLKSIPTLEFLKFKTFNMIDGEFKGGNVYLTHRNPHGRWSIQYHIRYGSGGQFRHDYSYIDEVEFFRCVEPTPEIKQFKRDLALKQLIN
jgi:hypothetical protein